MRYKSDRMRYTGGMSNAHGITALSAADMIAANLRAELSRQRWSGRKAAAALGLKPLYVNRRLNGEVELSGSDIVMFSELLDIPVSKLFEGTKKAPTPKGGGQSYTPPDSNREPTDYGLAPVTELPTKSEQRANTGTLAVVTPLRA